MEDGECSGKGKPLSWEKKPLVILVPIMFFSIEYKQ